jgi:hypothetical protein
MSGPSPRSDSAKAERQQRLAAALRSNLKRRKAQARKRSAASAGASEAAVRAADSQHPAPSKTPMGAGGESG